LLRNYDNSSRDFAQRARNRCDAIAIAKFTAQRSASSTQVCGSDWRSEQCLAAFCQPQWLDAEAKHKQAMEET